MMRHALGLGAVSLFCFACVVGCASSDGEAGQPEESSALTIEGYTEPQPDDADRALTAHPDVDPDKVIPRDLLGNALAFFDLNAAKVDNKRWLTVVDFSKHSGKKRFFLIDMQSGKVEPHVVAHGSGSDPGNTGIPTKCSNTEDTNMSSLGYYMTGETYSGKHGRSMRLDGVSGTNNNVRNRDIVVHTADYVSESSSRQGRSWGCLVLDEAVKDKIIDKIKERSVIYAEVAGHITSTSLTPPAPPPPPAHPHDEDNN
jgi:hypothetical protein